MSCTVDTVQLLEDNGREVGFKKTDCPLVEHWARKYKATVKRKWISPEGDVQVCGYDEALGWPYEEGDEVWVASSLILGASSEAYDIRRLVFAVNTEEYRRTRQILSDAGYPDDVLSAVPPPS